MFGSVEGQFGVRQEIETTNFRPYDAVSADVDKDGDQDVFVACHESFKPGGVPHVRAIADLRNDGAGNLYGLHAYDSPTLAVTGDNRVGGREAAPTVAPPQANSL